MLMLPGGYSSMIQALLLIALTPVAGAQELNPFCAGSQGNYSAGSTYETNLLGLLGALGHNASSSTSLFARGSLGAAPETVWGLVLCRGDISASDCSTCVATAGRDAGKICNRSRDVALLYEKCFVRMSSNQSFLDSGHGEVRLPSRVYINSADPEGYAKALIDLLGATVKYAADSSSSMFATGRWEGPDPGFHNIYSAAQCAADLSRPQCRNCLQTQLAAFPQYVRGARMAGPRCTLRSELIPFYNGSPMVLLNTTAPTAATTTGPRTLAIVIGLVVPLLVIASLAAAWFWCRRYRPGTQHKTQDSNNTRPLQIQVEPTGTSNATTEKENGQQAAYSKFPRPFLYEELAQATDNFSENKKLGQGNFGAVYKGTLAGIDTTTVAIKQILVNHLRETPHQTKKAFDTEIEIMSELHHRNILSLKGWCKEDNHLLLIYEIMENGSFDDYLYPKNGTMDTTIYAGTPQASHLSWPARHNILIGIASGLAYLHTECPVAIVHRDLKPANVMLDNKFNAKLADFGLVTQLGHTQTSRPTEIVTGTRSYIDPAYMDTGKVSVHCDIYSLGVVLLETVCGEKPIILPDGNKNSLIEKVRECDRSNKILDAAEEGLQGKYDKQIEGVLRLGLLCVLPSHHDRPHIGRVRDRLTELLSNGKGSAATTSQPSEEEFGTCRTTFSMHS